MLLPPYGGGSCVRFNPITGDLFFVFLTQGTNYGPFPRWCVMHGLTTLYDVQQTFVPSANYFGFKVPVQPKGMPAADHFDTYWGPLAHPINFSAAQPLACGYPSTPPHVGDYLTVPDPLPDPAPGTGRYYVTSSTHQGQTRYGRKQFNGQMSGRDPAVLPTCDK